MNPRKPSTLALLALTACSHTGAGVGPEAPAAHTPPRSTADAPRGDRFVTPTGKIWTLHQTMRSASLGVLTISGEGFPHTRDIELGEGDPFEAAYLTDLDGNGFGELFVVRRSVGSGSHAALSGVASNADQSFGLVGIPEPDAHDPLFAGYRGHDTLRVDGSCLVRSFPVYRDDDPNARPSGDTRAVCYRLQAGEAGFVLVSQAAP